MNEQAEKAAKVLENRLRRVADRRGYYLVRSRSRDPKAIDFGRYALLSHAHGKPVNPPIAGRRACSWTLAAVHDWLNQHVTTDDDAHQPASERIGSPPPDEPKIDPKTLSPTQQKKFEIAVRQKMRELMLQFEQRVVDEVHKRMDEIILPEWKRRISEAKELYNRRKSLMDKATFNLIRRVLHSDSRHSASDKMFNDAFHAFMGLEKFVLNEKDSPTTFGDDLPSSAAEWDKMKRKAREDRKRKKETTSKSAPAFRRN